MVDGSGASKDSDSKRDNEIILIGDEDGWGVISICAVGGDGI